MIKPLLACVLLALPTVLTVRAQAPADAPEPGIPVTDPLTISKCERKLNTHFLGADHA